MSHIHTCQLMPKSCHLACHHTTPCHAIWRICHVICPSYYFLIPFPQSIPPNTRFQITIPNRNTFLLISSCYNELWFIYITFFHNPIPISIKSKNTVLTRNVKYEGVGKNKKNKSWNGYISSFLSH